MSLNLQNQFLHLYFAFIVSMFLGAGVCRSEDMSNRIEVLEWKREGGTVRLGSPKNYPTWAGVDAPSNVVQSASAILGGEPSEWDVGNLVDFESQGKQVVCLSDAQGRHRLIYLVLPDKWVLLNHPKSVPYISHVLETFFKCPSELDDPLKVTQYVEAVAYLFKGPSRVALSKLFLRINERTFPGSGPSERPLGGWLQGKEKNPDALRSLCADPTVKVQGDDIEIQCNIITDRGSVEKWTLKGKLKQTVTLIDIVVTQIREEETFSYNYVP